MVSVPWITTKPSKFSYSSLIHPAILIQCPGLIFVLSRRNNSLTEISATSFNSGTYESSSCGVKSGSNPLPPSFETIVPPVAIKQIFFTFIPPALPDSTRISPPLYLSHSTIRYQPRHLFLSPRRSNCPKMHFPGVLLLSLFLPGRSHPHPYSLHSEG